VGQQHHQAVPVAVAAVRLMARVALVALQAEVQMLSLVAAVSAALVGHQHPI
jgi:hypothetical protein